MGSVMTRRSIRPNKTLSTVRSCLPRIYNLKRIDQKSDMNHLHGGEKMKAFVNQYLKDHRTYFETVSSYIYYHHETRFEEYDSSKYLSKQCIEMSYIDVTIVMIIS